MSTAGPPCIREDITQCIGNTPLVRLRRMTKRCRATVLAKMESMNPLGSVKDRIAPAMLDAAERAGLLQPGAVIVEPTSGNTGIGLAPGLRRPRLQAHRHHAGTHECRTTADAQGPGGQGAAHSVRERHVRRHPRRRTTGCPKPRLLHAPTVQQPSQPGNPPPDHGRGDLRDTQGAVDIVVAGVGTGGTITGVGQRLKAYKPAVFVVAVEPAGSAVITQHLAGEPLQPGKHAIQGLGAGFLPKVLDLDVIDEVIRVRDEDALQTTRRLACEEGLMCGVSSGAAAWAAIHLAKQAMNAGRQIVVILPDLGERYLSSHVFHS